MTDCAHYEPDLKAYADGELSWLRRRAVRRHLTHCASCREEITAMTQITEDLRAAESGDALPPSLREKLLADVPLAPNNGGTGTEPLPSGSPIIGGGGASSRRIPAWTFAALAITAWFVCYPLYQKAHQQVDVASSAVPTTEWNIKVFKPYHGPAPEKLFPPQRMAGIPEPVAASAPAALSAPKAAPTITVRLSDREAGTDRNGAPYVHIASGASPLNATDGNASSSLLNGDPDSLRQVHKEASIGIQVPNPEATGDKLNQMVQETGGYVAANNLTTGDDGLKSGELIVKVPEPQFETFLAHVAKLGVVQSKNITGEDITEKTSDASQAQSVEESDLQQDQARLKALGTHAKWEDTQNAEDLRVQLAQTRARLLLLKRMAALGTLTIDLSQTPKAVPAPPVTNGFTGTLKATTHDALQSLVGSAGALLALVIWLLAYAPIWVPLLLLGRYVLKEYKKREAV